MDVHPPCVRLKEQDVVQRDKEFPVALVTDKFFGRKRNVIHCLLKLLNLLVQRTIADDNLVFS